MAIDQNAILELLTQLQGGGGSPSISPISGIGGGTPLSGLALGEQGMGLGGGGSLLGGGGGLGGGGSAGMSLDMIQLLSQLQETPSGLPGGGAGFIGQPGGGGMGQTFGAGGAFQQFQGGTPAEIQPRQAGLGGGGLLGDISAGVKTGKTLSDVIRQLMPPAGGQDLSNIQFGQSLVTPGALSALTGTQDPQAVLSSLGFGDIGPGGMAQLGEQFPEFSKALGFPSPGFSFGSAGGVPGLPGFTPGIAEEAAALGLGGIGTAMPGAAAGGGGGGGGGLLSAGLLSAIGLPPGSDSVLAGLGGLGGGLYGALSAQSDIGKASGATSALGGALTLASLIPGLQFLLPFGVAMGAGGGAAGLFSSLFGGGKPSVYDIKRKSATGTAQADIAGLGAAQQSALAGKISPLQALNFLSGDISSIPGRNPVRSELLMPLDIASQLGFHTLPPSAFPGQAQYIAPGVGQYGTNIGAPWTNRVRAPWSALTPQTFQTFMNLYKKNPTAMGQTILGSGDVAYLPQGQAAGVANQAKQQTVDFFNQLLGLSTPMTQPTAASPPIPAVDYTQRIPMGDTAPWDYGSMP